MTGTEIIAIIGGAALGYWLIAVLLPNIKGGRLSDEAGLPPDFTDDGHPAPWHAILGVPEGANRTEITAAYKARISQYHPDKVASMAPEIQELAQTRSKEINAAYDIALKLRS